MENFCQNVSIESRARISISGVMEVNSFSDREITLKLKDNKRIVIMGNNLKILSFDNKNGNFTAQGLVDELKYKDAQEKFIKKVFK